MSVAAMFAHLLLERTSIRLLERIPESDLIMEDHDQLQAFAAGGTENGILAHLYLFHALMALPQIRSGDTVLDLACGPANQLALMAQLNPAAHFIGVDASKGMLEAAQSTLTRQGLNNATLRAGDMTRLSDFADQSIDAVVCTMSLHHLPDIAALHQCCHEIRRVLRAGGGLYLADFGRLKRKSTLMHFAYDRAAEQSERFTQDFLDSMQAAFSLEELRLALNGANLDASLHHTALAPFMFFCDRAARRAPDPSTRLAVRTAYARLSFRQRRDFDNMERWFKLGGANLPYSPQSNP